MKLQFAYSALASLLFACTLQPQADDETFKVQQVYRTDALIITRIAANSYIHTSHLQTDDFGNVPCNGLIVRDGTEAIIFDTPTTDSESAALIRWVRDSLACTIKAVIPTHFHHDCLGGLQVFHDHGIPSFANASTIELAGANGVALPQRAFTDTLKLQVDKRSISIAYFGAGHTPDNVVGYFPKDEVLFGGCLVKEVDASKGYLGDADTTAWSATVERVKQAYPKARVVIPGHGQHGGQELLDYTIELFKPR